MPLGLGKGGDWGFQDVPGGEQRTGRRGMRGVSEGTPAHAGRSQSPRELEGRNAHPDGCGCRVRTDRGKGETERERRRQTDMERETERPREGQELITQELASVLTPRAQEGSCSVSTT